MRTKQKHTMITIQSVFPLQLLVLRLVFTPLSACKRTHTHGQRNNIKLDKYVSNMKISLHFETASASMLASSREIVSSNNKRLN
jgi:hypothetical protein